MADGPEFPLDLKSIMKDCMLALFWPKKKILEFLEQSGCQATDLSVVRAPSSSDMKRPEIIADVFYRLGRRSDNGYMVFHTMLSRLNEWDYFDPYWFVTQEKLDRRHADECLAELRRIVTQRNAKTQFQRMSATKAQAAHVATQGLAELLTDFRKLAQGGIKPQQRGYEFERFLKRLFDQQNVGMSDGFRLVGEQIDGSFKFEGENYITEAKWQDTSVSTEALYKFAMKAEGKMYGRGVFISVNAYSNEGIRAIVVGKAIKTILIDGEDLTLVLEGLVPLSKMLDVKIRAAQLRGDVYVHPITQLNKLN
jgi:hypothetical protein